MTKKENYTAIILDYAKSITIAICIALFFRSCAFEAYKIPSSSMTPTLMIGDYLFISKYSYGYSKYSLPVAFDIMNGRVFAKPPQRGDVVVFRSPNTADDKDYYIKRLIGLPGERIQVKHGVLYINEQVVPRAKFGRYAALYKDEPQGVFDCYEETLPNGVKYKVLDANHHFHTQFPDETPVYTVPAGHYFMMGDHRNHSGDSRYTKEMGFIPEENLMGRAEILFWTRDFSFWNIVTKFNLNRLFKRLTYDATISVP